MQATQLTRGTVLQIDPENPINTAFGGCMLVVTECRPSKVMGYVQGLGETHDELGGQAYIFMPWEHVELVGRATWIIHGGALDD